MYVSMPCIGLAEPLVSTVQQAGWFRHGWDQLVNTQYQSALDVWQQGVNSMPDEQLLIALGAFQQRSNALDMIERAGPHSGVLMLQIRSNGKPVYDVLSVIDLSADIRARQVQLATLKKAAGINNGQLYTQEAWHFKTATALHAGHSSKGSATLQAATENNPVALSESGTFTINSFDVHGNQRISMDQILLGLKNFYGSGKQRSVLQRIQHQVIETYRAAGMFHARVEIPVLIDDDMIAIYITEADD